MGNKNDNIFDESLRRKLSGAGEMPPERVWNGIVSAMDAAPVGTGKPSRGKVLLLSLGLEGLYKKLKNKEET